MTERRGQGRGAVRWGELGPYSNTLRGPGAVGERGIVQ